jgi:hypothetical protein
MRVFYTRIEPSPHVVAFAIKMRPDESFRIETSVMKNSIMFSTTSAVIQWPCALLGAV